ncbi:unnamed protein product [Tenebrio molitor]|nr:unnamed protein product [Tenebrio molitor]
MVEEVDMQMRQLRLPKKSRNMVKFPVRVIYKTEKEFYGVLRIQPTRSK